MHVHSQYVVPQHLGQLPDVIVEGLGDGGLRPLHALKHERRKPDRTLSKLLAVTLEQ